MLNVYTKTCDDTRQILDDPILNQGVDRLVLE